MGGSVYRALDQRTGKVFAVKEVAVDQREEKARQFQAALENELEICKALRHPCIVSFLGYDRIDHKTFIYLEYMAGGSLQQVLVEFGALDESLVVTYTRDALRGLEYLHTQNPAVLHRDIKCGNILVDLQCHVKLADFGCSKMLDDDMTHTMRGSIPWMAPEVVKATGHGPSADIWSLGCAVIEMATACPPWGKFDNPVQAMAKIAMSKDLPVVPTCLSESGREFITTCVQRDKSARPCAAEALKLKFLQGAPAWME